MKTTLRFFKQNNKWYADVAGHTLEENEMVMGADTALDVLANEYGTDELYIDLSTEEDEVGELEFLMIDHDEDGAYYKVSGMLYEMYVDRLIENHLISEVNELNGTIWICNVTHDVFGEHPQKIVITNVRKEKEKRELVNDDYSYNKEQCIYGKDSSMPCMLCSATCRERYEDLISRGVNVVTIGDIKKEIKQKFNK